VAANKIKQNAFSPDLAADDPNASEVKTYDAQGFDRYGFNRRGFDRSGFNPTGFDVQGYDREGFNKDGFDQEGFNRCGYNRQGRDRQGYLPSGYHHLTGLARSGYNKDGFDKDGFSRAGFNLQGFDRQGFNSQGFNLKGFDRQGFDRTGFDKVGRDPDGYNLDGYNQAGFDRAGYNRQGYDGFGKPHPFFVPDSAGYYSDGLDREGYDREGYDPEGRDRWGYDGVGYDEQGFDRNGFNKAGLSRKDGRTWDGFDPEGFRPKRPASFDLDYANLFDRFGFDRQGCGRDGYTITGYDKDGYDRAGYDLGGRDRHNRNRQGRQLKTPSFNREGYNRQGYDRWGFNRRGLTKDGENFAGWLFDATTGMCRHPLDLSRQMPHRFTFGKPGSWERLAAPAHQPPITPREDLTLDQLAAQFNLQKHSIREVQAEYYRRIYRQGGRNIQRRWFSTERAKSDRLACREGALLVCPYCARFVGDQLDFFHQCPAFNGQKVKVFGNGRGIIYNQLPQIAFFPGESTDTPTPPPEPAPPGAEPTPFQKDGYDPNGFDRHGYDRTGFDKDGYNRDGYDRQGYSRSGYDRDGFDRDGYNAFEVDRLGHVRHEADYQLEQLAKRFQDSLGNFDALDNVAIREMLEAYTFTLTGKKRTIVFKASGQPGTDLNGTITLVAYPLGRKAPLKHNLAVLFAAVEHELGHELYTDAEHWRYLLKIAASPKPVEGLDRGRKLLLKVYNILEDGRMERQLGQLAGVAEHLALGCRYQPRWDEWVGEDEVKTLTKSLAAAGLSEPVAHTIASQKVTESEVYGGLLYTALPFFQVRPEVRAVMTEAGRTLFEQLEPLAVKAALGTPQDTLEMAFAITRRLEVAGFDLPSKELDIRPPGGSEFGDETGDNKDGSGKNDINRPASQGKTPASAGTPSSKPGQEPEPGQAGKERSTSETAGPADAAANVNANFSEEALAHALENLTRQGYQAVEAEIDRRTRIEAAGKALHMPLGNRQESRTQIYFNAQNRPVEVKVSFPCQADLFLQDRRSTHRTQARRLALHLKQIRDEVRQKMTLQPRGQLDRKRLVQVVKGNPHVFTRQKMESLTSFVTSLCLDQSGSMEGLATAGRLYDAAMTLADALEVLEIAYEVRGFNHETFHYKALQDRTFDQHRAEKLAWADGYTSAMHVTAGLATTALVACPERHKLLVFLTDGELQNHAQTVAQLDFTRQNKITVFGLFLGTQPPRASLNELYGPKNWVAINHLEELPGEMGKRLAYLMQHLDY
jgi:hypothetical protein